MDEYLKRKEKRLKIVVIFLIGGGVRRRKESMFVKVPIRWIVWEGNAWRPRIALTRDVTVRL